MTGPCCPLCELNDFSAPVSEGTAYPLRVSREHRQWVLLYSSVPLAYAIHVVYSWSRTAAAAVLVLYSYTAAAAAAGLVTSGSLSVQKYVVPKSKDYVGIHSININRRPMLLVFPVRVVRMILHGDTWICKAAVALSLRM